MKYLLLPILSLLLMQPVFALSEGASIYLKGTDAKGNPLPAILNDLPSSAPLGCTNCHRESGFGGSESGRTFPPVSWYFLGKNQPQDDSSRFYHIQNKRRAYTAESFYRLMTTGVNSNGDTTDGLMPRYALSREQSAQLIEYLKAMYTGSDPGVDAEVMRIATIVDKRLPELNREQHIAYLRGLFDMKNGLTRGELKRKLHSPVQKIPQYESFRKWELVVWELPQDTSLWAETLSEYYRQTPVFTVIRPMVVDSYAGIADFCTDNRLSCMFPSGQNLPSGDFYNYVFRDRQKQYRDYIVKSLRQKRGRLLYVDEKGDIKPVTDSMRDIPRVSDLSLSTLQLQYENYCAEDYSLLVKTSTTQAAQFEGLKCSSPPRLKLKVMADDSVSYQSIVDYMGRYADSSVCWVSDYDKVLKRNLRKIRVNAMVRRFNIKDPDEEEMAKTLLAYGLLNDSIHKMAGNFSRVYMLEIIEHMLNSFPNYSFYSEITGSPYQRYISGPVNEYCPAGV